MGHDAGREVVQRKCYFAVDMDGCPLVVNLPLADMFDSADARIILNAVCKRWPWVEHLLAYDCLQSMGMAICLDFIIEIIHCCGQTNGYDALQRRWVAERTFS